MKVKPIKLTQKELLPKGLLHPRIDFTQLECQFDVIEKKISFLHVTDFHLGYLGFHSWLTINRQIQLMKKLVDIIKKYKPAALLFTGDLSTKVGFPGHFSASSELLDRILFPLRTISIPKYATLGNHDNIATASRVILQNYGFITASKYQQHPLISDPMENFSIWALPDFETQRKLHDKVSAHIAKNYASLDKKTLPIILAHNPDSFDHLPADLKYFGLAGHTHGGGYMNRKMNKLAIKILGLENKSYDSGIFTTPVGSIVYISRGAGRHIGTPLSTMPMEVTLVSILGTKKM
ncbi:metallophosphoesterase [soil metagenome]